jgi:hypothetical protein
LAANLRKKTIGCKFLRDYFQKRREMKQIEPVFSDLFLFYEQNAVPLPP